MTVVKALNPKLLLVVFTKCGTTNSTKEDFSRFRDELWEMCDTTKMNQKSLNYYLFEEFPDQVPKENTLIKGLQARSKDDLPRWITGRIDSVQPKLDMHDLKRKSYEQM